MKNKKRKYMMEMVEQAHDNTAYRNYESPEPNAEWREYNNGKRNDLDIGKSNDDIIDVVNAADNDNNDEDDDEDIDAIDDSKGPIKLLLLCRRGVIKLYSRHKSFLKAIAKMLFLVGVCVYLYFAMSYNFGDEGSILVLVICCIAIVCILNSFVGRWCMAKFSSLTCRDEKMHACLNSRVVKTLSWVTLGLGTLALLIWVMVTTGQRHPPNLWSLLGVAVIMAIVFLFSKHPGKIRWRVVVWGLLLQLCFGLLVLRTTWGYESFKWIATKLSNYIDHTRAASSFVFGESYTDHYVAFVLLPAIVMFSSTISILYYLGVMKVFIRAISFVIRKTLGTGPMETLHATFNIFAGWAETIAVVSPLMNDMTRSELHAIMVNGFSTVSGGTMAGYIVFGAPANHLLAASFMSAPAALALSKVFYPEVRLNRLKMKTPKIVQSERSVVEAASAGAISAIPLVAYILVHIIAFVAIVDFINDTIAWLGGRVGVEPPDYPVMSFQFICSYLMFPVAFLMGVESDDLRVSSRLLGVKIFLNEFIAFQDLGTVVRNSATLKNYTTAFPNATWHWTQTDDIFLNATGQTLIGGVMSDRSAVITTYALCGFSDFTALGMMIGALTAAAPKRKKDILRVSARALFTGIMANFLTASLADVALS